MVSIINKFATSEDSLLRDIGIDAGQPDVRCNCQMIEIAKGKEDIAPSENNALLCRRSR
jgi:hypothetical protein